MKNKISASFFAAFKTMLPIVPGAVPTAVAYALLATSSGMTGLNVVLSSLVVFAGSVQFISIELIKNNMSYIQFAIIVFLLHSRHMFFGISLFDKFNKAGRAKPLLIYWLTDETYAVMTNESRNLRENVHEGLYYIFIGAIMYVSWNIGTAIGVFASWLITFNTEGMEFALTAMFLVIVLEQFKSHKSKLPFIIGGISAVLSFIVIGPQSMLLGCCVVSVISLLLARKYIEAKSPETEANT